MPILLNQASNLFNQGRNRVLEEWLETLPEETIADQPWLLFWLGTARIPFDPASAASLLEKAVEEFKVKEDLQGLLFASLRLINAIEFEGRNLAGIDRLFPILGNIAEKVKESPSPEIEFLLAINFFYAMFSRQRENPEIDIWAEHAWQLVNRTPHHQLQTTFFGFLTTYWLNKGRGNLKKPANGTKRFWRSMP